MKRTHRRALIGSILGIATACAVYDDSLVGERRDPTLEDSGAPKCELAKWPAKPEATDLEGSTNIVFALRRFDFGELYRISDDAGVDPRPLGYDLDDLCTAGRESTDPLNTEQNGCRAVGDWFDPVIGDLKGGRDNGLRHLIEFISNALTDFGTRPYQERILKGDVSLLFEIRGYNEQPNDSKVEFIVYTPGNFHETGSNAVIPKFDGTDVWPVDRGSFKNSDPLQGPALIATSGYVKDGVLVAAGPNEEEFKLRIGVSATALVDLPIRFIQPLFTARITKEPSPLDRNKMIWMLRDGQLAARWRTSDLLSVVKYFPNPAHDVNGPQNDPANSRSMCMTAIVYPIVRQAICESAEISSTGPGPDARCDAISVGIFFESVEAKLGAVVTVPEPVTDCTAANDPKADKCQNDKVVLPTVVPDAG